MHDNKIAILKTSEIDQASKILTKAFNKDPMFRYLGIETEQEPSRVNADALQWFCDLSLRNCQPHNHVYVTQGDIKGVAVWIPPGKSEMTIWQFIKMLLALPGKCGWHRLGRCLSLFYTLERRHQQEMTEPHWILSLLAVAPTCQGQGIGSLLLQPVLKQADREGISCYLSTFTEQAVYFYQKHDFEVLWRGKFSEGSPDIWTMKRRSKSLTKYSSVV